MSCFEWYFNFSQVLFPFCCLFFIHTWICTFVPTTMLQKPFIYLFTHIDNLQFDSLCFHAMLWGILSQAPLIFFGLLLFVLYSYSHKIGAGIDFYLVVSALNLGLLFDISVGFSWWWCWKFAKNPRLSPGLSQFEEYASC